jgi:hypothetical protein
MTTMMNEKINQSINQSIKRKHNRMRYLSYTNDTNTRTSVDQ